MKRSVPKTDGHVQLDAWLSGQGGGRWQQVKDLAEVMEVKPSTIAHWRAVRANPSLALAFELEYCTGIEARSWVEAADDDE